MLGERELGGGDRLGSILVPLGQRQIAVPRLEQSEFRHERSTPSLAFSEITRRPHRTSLVDRPAEPRAIDGIVDLQRPGGRS